MNKKKRGILLVTTLLIISFLVALSVGFVEINRDNLVLAERVSESEQSIEAAYAGLQYTLMRFEQDKNFGISRTSNTATPNGAPSGPGQNAAFPDGSPGGVGGIYWASGGVVMPFNLPYLTVRETGTTVVGFFGSNAAHFQVHFAHFNASDQCPANPTGSGYGVNGFKDDSIASNAPGTWKHAPLAANLHSCNNLNNSKSVIVGGKTVPPYSARIISIGYSNGSKHMVEALLRRVVYTNSSIASGSDITIRMTTPAVSGDQTWHISSLAPLSNNVVAGLRYDPSSGTFKQVGGNINAYSGFGGSLPQNQIAFSTAGNSKYNGAGYALRPVGGSLTDASTPGVVQNIDGKTYPTSSGLTSVSTGNSSGTLYSKADTPNAPPSKDLSASDILGHLCDKNGTCAGSTQDSQGTTIPQNNAHYISSGIWAFNSHGGKGDRITVYDFSGNQIAQYQGQVTASDGTTVIGFVNNYQLMIKPGMNVIVGDGPSNTAAGNFMLTLDPTDFPSNSNQDPTTSNFVIPTLALSYKQSGQLGAKPASLTLGGNLYVQGQLVGFGAVVAEANTSSPASTWIPPSNNWTNGWAGLVVGNSNQGAPPSGDTGDVFVEGNSQVSNVPTASLSLYAQGTAQFNPIPATLTTSGSLDMQAFGTASSNFAGGSNGDGGYWDNDQIPGINDVFNNFLYFSNDESKTTQLLRCSGCENGSLENASTGKTAQDLFGAVTADTSLMNYLGGSAVPGTPLDLYHYTLLSQYKSTQDSKWLTDFAPFAGPIPLNVSDPDSVELAILSSMNKYAEQAYSGNQQFGLYLANGAPTSSYTAQDMAFRGLVYARNGFQANPANYQFTMQGTLMTPQGPVEVDNAGQANFIYDPTQIMQFYQDPNIQGNRVDIQWVTVW